MRQGKNVVRGEVAPGFEAVREAFEKNFTERQELGAAVTIFQEGRKVVDLWGGTREGRAPWTEDTMVLLFSATKGMASTALAKLHSEGLLDYEERIATYWPTFAKSGKENITVRQLLTHQAGLVLLKEKLPVEKLWDFDGTRRVLEEAEPLWEPGKYQGYQAGTVGFFMGELVRRVDGKKRSLGRYFHEEIAIPLELDFHIGLPDAVPQERIAKIRMVHPLLALFHLNKMPEGMRKAMLSLDSTFMKSTLLVKGYDPNGRATLRVEQPSGNGIGTARAVARLYSDLALGGKDLRLRPETVEILHGLPEHPPGGTMDQVIRLESRYGMGFMKPDPVFRFSENPRALGFLGATGSFAFADPEKRVGYAYLTRRMGYHGVNDPRERSVREAMFRCLERR